MAKDFVDCKIDQDRMTDGKALATELRKGKRGGIPWSVFLRPDGTAIIDSDGPKGNIGCPIQPAERAHFVAMVEAAKIRLTEDEINALAKDLDAYAKGVIDQQKRAREAASKKRARRASGK